jgi:twitching motility protein PilT
VRGSKDGRVADRIIDPKRTPEIHQIIDEGEYYGMMTFDQSLLGMVQNGLVTVEDAVHSVSNPHDLGLRLEQAGIRIPA